MTETRSGIDASLFHVLRFLKQKMRIGAAHARAERVVCRRFKCDVTLAACATILDLDALTALGVKANTSGRPSYEERQGGCPRTQEVGEPAHFHGRNRLLVPSARSDHLNPVALCGVASFAAVEEGRDHGVIDWARWRKQPFRF